ncbi:methylmalonyl-CoA mutase family protein [Streptomyces murinus]
MSLATRTTATAGPLAYPARGSAGDCNAHLSRQVERGARHLLICADRPTGLGMDSDDPAVRGSVGRCGGAVDSIDDMRVLLRGLPLDEITATLLAEPPGAALLVVLWALVAQERGVGGQCRVEVLLRPSPGPAADGYDAPSMSLLTAVCAPAGIPVRAASPGELRQGGQFPRTGWDMESYGPDLSPLGVIEVAQAERLAKLRAWRCEDRLDVALAALRDAAGRPADMWLRAALGDALAAGATLAEVSGVLDAARRAARVRT